MFCKWNRNRTYASYNFLLTLKTTANSNTKRRPRSSLSLLSGHLGNKLSNKKAWSWQVLGAVIFFCHFAFLFFIDPNQVDVVCINVNSGKIFYNTIKLPGIYFLFCSYDVGKSAVASEFEAEQCRVEIFRYWWYIQASGISGNVKCNRNYFILISSLLFVIYWKLDHIIPSMWIQ